MKKQTMYALIAALVLLQLYSLTRISSLQNMIENNHNSIYSVENQLNSQINSIYQNVDQKLEEQASLIHSSSTQIGEIDVETLAIPVTFTVQPKTVKENMHVSLDFDGEIIQLDQSGLSFSTTKAFKLYDSISPKIIINDAGVLMVEEHQGLRVWRLGSELFPEIFSYFMGQTSYGSGQYKESGEINFDYKYEQEMNPIVEMNYVVKVDDEIIKTTSVPLEKSDNIDGMDTFEIDNSYPLHDGQILTTFIIAKDSLGFTHEFLTSHYEAGANAQMEPHLERTKITAPNGEIIFYFDSETGTEINLTE